MNLSEHSCEIIEKLKVNNEHSFKDLEAKITNILPNHIINSLKKIQKGM